MTLTSIILSFITKNGIVSPLLAFQIALLVSFVYLIKNVVLPIAKQLHNAKTLDRLAGATEKHWLFGHLKQFPTTESGLLKGVREMTRLHPTMFNRWVSPFSSGLHVYHADTASALLSSGAPKDNFGYKFVRPWVGDGLLTSKGKKWQRNRRLLTPAFHFSVLKGYTQVFTKCGEVLLNKWQEQLNEPVDISRDVSLMTLEIMLKCAMSSESHCQDASANHPYVQAIQELGYLTNLRITTPYLIPDFIFWRSKPGKSFQRAADVVHQHAEKIISDRRKYLLNQSNFDLPSSETAKTSGFFHRGKKRLDFLDILLQTKDEDGNGLSEREIRDEVDTFLFEGHDTTSSGISWALYNLAKYPELQEACRKEVADILQDKDTIEWNDYARFTYLTMFIKESLRLYPPVLIIGRELENDMTVKSNLHQRYETVVPRSCRALVNIFTLHRNENMWEDPEKFDPERFSKENISKRSPCAYVPFSAGSRNCIGQNFAMNEMKTFLAHTLRRYRLYLDEETPAPEMQARLILQSKNGIFVKLQKL